VAVRASRVDAPDELRIDLDPQPGTDFADAVAVAGIVHEVLTTSVTRPTETSGGRGIHVYVRIVRLDFIRPRGRDRTGFAGERRPPDLAPPRGGRRNAGEKVPGCGSRSMRSSSGRVDT